MNTDIIVALIALAASGVATTITFISQKSIRLLEGRMKKQDESAQFLTEKLTQLYLPVAMHMVATKSLIDRFYNAEPNEQIAIEHEMRLHNNKILDCLMTSSVYLEEDIPETMTEALIRHLIQWEIVYKLKYEYKVYDGPVFAGISKFGFIAFPQGANKYFQDKVEELKKRYLMLFREGL